MFGIAILFLGLCITPSIAINNVKKSTYSICSGNTLYVGGSGEGNYTKIQDAIDDAYDGDTVYVYDDSSPYYELVIVYKTINLIGEDKNTTVIDGQHEGTTVKITADNCLVSGFTIKNCRGSGNEFRDSVVEIFYSDYVTIKDNILTMGDFIYNDWTSDVKLYNSTYCTIHDNIMIEDKYQRRTIGVVILDGSSFNIISNNNISKYTEGISTVTNLTYGNRYNVILGNHIHNNLYGIEILGDTHYEILNNTIENNEYMGIDCTDTHYTTISGNIISNNGVGDEFDCGVMLTWYSKDNYISDNVISKNNPTGIFMLTAIDNVVTRNNIIDNWGKSGTPERWWGNAFFNYELSQWRFLRLNCWRRNYWGGSSNILPKVIHGDIEILGLIYLPRIEFDWFPAHKPYDIDM